MDVYSNIEAKWSEYWFAEGEPGAIADIPVINTISVNFLTGTVTIIINRFPLPTKKVDSLRQGGEPKMIGEIFQLPGGRTPPFQYSSRFIWETLIFLSKPRELICRAPVAMVLEYFVKLFLI